MVDLKYLSFAYLQDKPHYRVLQVQKGKNNLTHFLIYFIFHFFFPCTYNLAIVNSLGSLTTASLQFHCPESSP